MQKKPAAKKAISSIEEAAGKSEFGNGNEAEDHDGPAGGAGEEEAGEPKEPEVVPAGEDIFDHANRLQMCAMQNLLQ